MKSALLATTFLTLATAAHAQSLQTGNIGGMPYYLLPASGGCSASTPCSIVTYLSYMGEADANTASDVQKYFGGSFAAANPHTVVVAPMITIHPQSETISWGGYVPGVTTQEAQGIAVVKAIEAKYGNTINPADSTVIGGSLGGTGAQDWIAKYGPKGTVQPGLFSAGVSFDGKLPSSYTDPATIAAFCGVPFMAVHGTADTNQSPMYDISIAQSVDSNPACGNSFQYVPIQGAGHGTWNAGLSAGVGSGTALGWVTQQIDAKAGAAVPTTSQTAATTPVAATATTPGATPSATATTPTAAAPTAATETTPATASAQPDDDQSPQSATIKPGGSITDVDGHVWTITASGSIQKDGQYVNGGGGTSALTIGADGTVFGLDSGHGPVNPGGWFRLNDTGDAWAISQPPGSATAAVQPTAAQTATAAQSAPTQDAQTVPAPGICGGARASGAFKMVNGRFIDPGGSDWIARGINVSGDSDLGSAAQMIQLFPGLNFVRLAVYKYHDPSYYADFIKFMTARGTVVEIEHHVETDGHTGGGGQGGIGSGAWLAAENAFYQSVAAAFKDNPYVWFGTDNEPPELSGLSQWQRSTYDAIRGTGNKNPILLEVWGSRASGHGMYNLQAGMDASVYASMTNTAWDVHIYPYQVDGSSDATVLANNINAMAAAAQTIRSADGIMPVILAEFGPSTTGSSSEGNGMASVDAVINSGSAEHYGSAVWHWGMQDCCNNLNSGSKLTDLGERIQLFINTDVQPCTAAQTTANAQQAIVQAQQQTAAALTSPQAAGPAATTPPSDDTSVASALATAQASQQSMAAIDAQLAPALAQAPQIDPASAAALKAQGDAYLAAVQAALSGAKQ